MDLFSAIQKRVIFQVYYNTQVKSEISDSVTNTHRPDKQQSKANEGFVSMPSTKKQRKHSTTSSVSPFVLYNETISFHSSFDGYRRLFVAISSRFLSAL